MTGKRLSRRDFLKLMAGAAAGGALVACTPQVVKETVVVEKPVEKVVKETVVVQPTAAPAKEEITLTWAWWGSVANLAAATPKTRPFRQRFPHVVVQPVYMPGSEYGTKILTMFAGGTAPDVIMVEAESAPGWFSKGLAVQLDPLLGQSLG